MFFIPQSQNPVIEQVPSACYSLKSGTQALIFHLEERGYSGSITNMSCFFFVFDGFVCVGWGHVFKLGALTNGNIWFSPQSLFSWTWRTTEKYPPQVKRLWSVLSHQHFLLTVLSEKCVLSDSPYQNFQGKRVLFKNNNQLAKWMIE